MPHRVSGLLSLALVVPALSGCLSQVRHTGPLPAEVPLPALAGNAAKPVVAVDLRAYGKPAASATAEDESLLVAQSVQARIERIQSEDQLFSRLDFDPANRAQARYVLKLRYYQSTNDFKTGALVTGATFGVVPSNVETRFELRADVLRPDGSALASLPVGQGRWSFTMGFEAVALKDEDPELLEMRVVRNTLRTALIQMQHLQPPHAPPRPVSSAATKTPGPAPGQPAPPAAPKAAAPARQP